MDIEIRHHFEISFAEPVNTAIEHLLVVPLSGPTQTVKDWHLEMPGYEHAARYLDAFGNLVLHVSQTGPIRDIPVTVSGVVQTVPGTGVVGLLADDPVPALFKRVTPTTRSPVSVWGKYRNIDLNGPDRLDVLHGLMARVHAMLGAESEGLAAADRPDAAAYAHAFIGAVRALDMPARFVQGYLAGENGSGGPHEWAEAFDPSLGWVAFDPLLDLCPTDRHVRIATGLDQSSCPPVRVHPDPIAQDDMPPPEIEVTVAADMGQQQSQS